MAAASPALEGGVFVDNDPDMCAQLVAKSIPGLTTIQANQTAQEVALISVMKPAFSEFGDTNSYLNALRTTYEDQEVPYDSASGITEEQFGLIFTELGKLPGSAKFAIFDWDRTITKFEGWLAESSVLEDMAKPKPESAALRKDLLLFICGGSERLEMIKTNINRLIGEGVAVFVMTNNSGCGKPDFTNLVAELDPRIKIICSRSYNKNKGEAFVKSGFFKVPAPKGGYRKNRVTRNRKFAGGRRSTRRQRVNRKRRL